LTRALLYPRHDLAKAYGFTDTDGSQPEVWRYMADEEAGVPGLDPQKYR
jgi:hypothetical protein